MGAVGQAFIFYTISSFDPLVCTTVTTTRKVFSVLLSIFTKGHQLNNQGWAGIAMACGGILGELEEKYSASKKSGKVDGRTRRIRRRTERSTFACIRQAIYAASHSDFATKK